MKKRVEKNIVYKKIGNKIASFVSYLADTKL